LTRPTDPGKLSLKMKPRYPNRLLPRGLTTLEILVILLVVVGGLFGAWTASEKWKQGKDRSQCILNIRNAQTAMRSWQGMSQKAVGAAIDPDAIFGPGRFLERMPVCPSGGYYQFARKVPPVDTAYMSCSLATSLNHQPATTKGW
jgi:hypothetical protein